MPRDVSEFFVGYEPTCPPGIARRVRVFVVSSLAVSLGVAALLLAAQAPFARAGFEFGTVSTFRGTLRERPVPTLVVERPGSHGDAPRSSQLLLVAPGKHGASPDVAGRDGRLVELRGTLVYREGQTMIELETGSIATVSGDPTAPEPASDLGTHTLQGEIVDSKCHLGVMRPGEGKTHRDCAVRCLSGGVPAILRVVGEDGTSRSLLLLGAGGEMINHRILDRVAEPVAVTGRVERIGDLLVLYANPADVTRIAGRS